MGAGRRGLGERESPQPPKSPITQCKAASSCQLPTWGGGCSSAIPTAAAIWHRSLDRYWPWQVAALSSNKTLLTHFPTRHFPLNYRALPWEAGLIPLLTMPPAGSAPLCTSLTARDESCSPGKPSASAGNESRLRGCDTWEALKQSPKA